MKQYPRTFEEHSSYGSALRLLDRAGLTEGVVLDLGCGRSPLAEPLAERGLVHVGCDVDADALADLAGRGSETHEVSLLAEREELRRRLREVLAGRPLAAVLALDVLEHLPDPTTALLSVRDLVLEQEGAPAPLMVSIPNVTHADIAAKLLLGRWDVDDTGLLDDTHLRFFGEDELGRLLVAGGWSATDRDDVSLALSDQAFPTDAPSIRPGAPLRELVRAVRGAADPHSETYQFVRLLVPAEPGVAPYHVEIDEERPMLGALVVTGAGATAADAAGLLADLAAQEPPLAEVAVVDRSDLDEALRACGTRWVAVLDPATRLVAGWSARLTEIAEVAAGHVIQVGGTVLPDDELAALPSGPVDPGAVGGGEPLAPGAFDPLHAAPAASVSTSAFLVPLEAVRAAGLVPGPARPMGAERSLWLARAVQLSGMTAIGDPLVVVGVSSLSPPGAGAPVTDALDGSPLLLPAGSARRLADLRHRVVAAESALAEAERRRDEAEHRAAHFAEHLARIDADREPEHVELERLRREHARRPSRRVVAYLRTRGILPR